MVRPHVPLAFVDFEGGIAEIGHAGEGFAFDNEEPRHRVWLEPYRLANRAITNGEWLEFIDGGRLQRAGALAVRRLADGRARGLAGALYWHEHDGDWHADDAGRTAAARPECARHPRELLRGRRLRPLERRAPSHRMRNGNTPRAVSSPTAISRDTGICVRCRPAGAAACEQMFGDVWEWTASAYAPYPGYRPAAGAVGEYNGKFMCNQMVLQGRIVRDAERPCARQLPQFFLSAPALAVHGPAPGRGRACPQPRSPVIATKRSYGTCWDGLSAAQKTLPCKYFYDREGSLLFDAICDLPEYYPTRTEAALLRAAAPELARLVPRNAALVEFGSGSSVKTRILLDALTGLSAYVPVDISAGHLARVAADIAADYDRIDVVPCAADFTEVFAVPPDVADRPRVGFFPGSTIGNFAPAEAARFLRMARETLGEQGMLILGIDLVKDPDTLIAAYDDAAGVTARFNKNVLARINRDLWRRFRPERICAPCGLERVRRAHRDAPRFRARPDGDDRGPQVRFRRRRNHSHRELAQIPA